MLALGYQSVPLPNPPAQPMRASLTMFVPKVDLSEPCAWKRSEYCPPELGKPGHRSSALLRRSGVASKRLYRALKVSRCFDVRLASMRRVGKCRVFSDEGLNVYLSTF